MAMADLAMVMDWDWDTPTMATPPMDMLQEPTLDTTTDQSTLQDTMERDPLMLSQRLMLTMDTTTWLTDTTTMDTTMFHQCTLDTLPTPMPHLTMAEATTADQPTPQDTMARDPLMLSQRLMLTMDTTTWLMDTTTTDTTMLL